MADLNSMDLKLNTERSHYDEVEHKESTDGYLTSVSGSWFPPTPRKDKLYS